MKKQLALFIIVILLLCSCSHPSEVLKVGTWKTAQTIQPFFYADYTDRALEILPFTNPGDQKVALLAGELDMCGTTLVTAIMAMDKGEPIRIVSSLCNKCSALVTGKSADISNIEDLKGKCIGYVPGTMHHILLLEALEKGGLNPENDVELIRIDFFDMGQALKQGEIDAFCSGEPFPSIAVTEGYGRILEYPYYDESIGYINGVMITTEDSIKTNREAIKTLIKAHILSSEHLKIHQEEWLNTASEFGTPKKYLDVAASNMELSWAIDETMIKQTETLAMRMKELGLIHTAPEVRKYFETAIMDEITIELEKEQ